VEEIGPDVFRVTARAASTLGVAEVAVTLRLTRTLAEARPAFSPLLERFTSGTDWRTHAVKISDSGRIRNELQTLISPALEHLAGGGIRVRFERIEEAVLSRERQARLREVLRWYKRHHPVWFAWLEVDAPAEPGEAIPAAGAPEGAREPASHGSGVEIY
jgi:hypothetical protein